VKRRVLVSADEATASQRQHKKPCSDCPWRRDALPGWLGPFNAQNWARIASTDALIECHVFVGPQCAGAAIIRANMCKLPRDPDVLRLPADRVKVFSNTREFIDYHQKGPTNAPQQAEDR
jgi:hypothetical protein